MVIFNFNINQDSLGIKWDTIITNVITILVVYLAYLFNKRLNRINQKEDQHKKILHLIGYLGIINSFIVAYKALIDKKCFDGIHTATLLPLEIDNIKTDEYLFLTDYNLYYLNVIDIINRQINSTKGLIEPTKKLIDVYNQAVVSGYKEDLPKVIESLNNAFNLLGNEIKNLDILLFITAYSITKCIIPNVGYNIAGKIRKLLYFKDIEAEYPDYKNVELYKNWMDTVEQGAYNSPNIRCFWCSFWGSIMAKLNYIWLFITVKPEKCPKRKDKNDKN